VAEVSAQRAHWLAQQLSSLDGFELAFPGPFLWEFVLRCPRPAREVLDMLWEHGILGGIDLGAQPLDGAAMPDCILVAGTEMNSPRSLQRYVDALS
jgi:glycine dehydrogenase subunit 1